MGGEFTLGFLFRTDAQVAFAAAPGQAGKAFKGGLGGAEMIDQVAEGARADVFGADQPKP